MVRHRDGNWWRNEHYCGAVGLAVSGRTPPDLTAGALRYDRLMARSRFNDPIEPMDLANMRQNGVRSLAIQCPQCRHEVIMKEAIVDDQVERDV